MDLLREIHDKRGTTIVLVTHDRELADMADARLVLRDGRVVENTLRAGDREPVAVARADDREPFRRANPPR
jgi:ABC-type dipeptide/oligopeptide/nickel transport system ATPase component